MLQPRLEEAVSQDERKGSRPHVDHQWCLHPREGGRRRSVQQGKRRCVVDERRAQRSRRRQRVRRRDRHGNGVRLLRQQLVGEGERHARGEKQHDVAEDVAERVEDLKVQVPVEAPVRPAADARQGVPLVALQHAPHRHRPDARRVQRRQAGTPRVRPMQRVEQHGGHGEPCLRIQVRRNAQEDKGKGRVASAPAAAAAVRREQHQNPRHQRGEHVRHRQRAAERDDGVEPPHAPRQPGPPVKRPRAHRIRHNQQQRQQPRLERFVAGLRVCPPRCRPEHVAAGHGQTRGGVTDRPQVLLLRRQSDTQAERVCPQAAERCHAQRDAGHKRGRVAHRGADAAVRHSPVCARGVRAAAAESMKYRYCSF
eukprot:Rhum_TRINITY_DN6549_c0_g1::Rhum_TRINITY_DN6549_c0_g1_i1::g.20400::m.20400